MYVIGICGLSGSGKSTVSKTLVSRFPEKISVLEHDMYYYAKKDKPHINNYDHPDALETSLLISHINQLQNNKPIERPTYDFSVSDRKNTTQTILPRPILIVEGLLIFTIPELIPLFDLRIYIDVPLDIAIMRRILRDHADRGRSVKSIITQYQRTVRDAAIHLVQPCRYLADLIIPQGANNLVALEVLYGKIRDLLSSKEKLTGLIKNKEPIPVIGCEHIVET